MKPAYLLLFSASLATPLTNPFAGLGSKFGKIFGLGAKDVGDDAARATLGVTDDAAASLRGGAGGDLAHNLNPENGPASLVDNLTPENAPPAPKPATLDDVSKKLDESDAKFNRLGKVQKAALIVGGAGLVGLGVGAAIGISKSKQNGSGSQAAMEPVAYISVEDFF